MKPKNGRRVLGLWGTVLIALVLAILASTLGVTEGVLLVLFAVAAVAANLYVFFYWFRPWRSTRQGEALMVKGWGNLILLNLGLATLVLGENYPGRQFFRVLGLTAFSVGITYLLATLIFSEGAREYPPYRWRRQRR